MYEFDICKEFNFSNLSKCYSKILTIMLFEGLRRMYRLGLVLSIGYVLKVEITQRSIVRQQHMLESIPKKFTDEARLSNRGAQTSNYVLIVFLNISNFE